MDNKNLNDPYIKEPVKTSDGRPWTQNCYLCGKQIDLIKDPFLNKWMRVGKYIRHRKCYPAPMR